MFGRGDEPVGGNDDVITGADPQSYERQLQGIGAAAHANRVRDTAVGGPGVLEVLDGLTVHETCLS